MAEEVRTLKAAPHVAQKPQGSAIDGRTTRHDGYRAKPQNPQADQESLRLGRDRRPAPANQIPRLEEGRRANDFYLCDLYPDAAGRPFRLALQYRLSGRAPEIRQKADFNPFGADITG